jgi:orotate phosphoribosyltransferase
MNRNRAETLARVLLETQSVRLNVQQPFTWSSGLKSPMYCDNRRLLSYPEALRQVVGLVQAHLQEVHPGCTGLAGVATGAIALTALLADRCGLPMVYIRPKAKEHGLGNQVEGHVWADRAYVVVEDLVSTGGSSATAYEALREQTPHVLGLMALFSYGLPAAEARFSEARIPFTCVTTFEVLAAVAREHHYLTTAELDTLLPWQTNPQAWSDTWLAAHARS